MHIQASNPFNPIAPPALPIKKGSALAALEKLLREMLKKIERSDALYMGAKVETASANQVCSK